MYNHSTKTFTATILLFGFAALFIANSSAVNFVAKATGKALDKIITATKPSKGQRIINGKSIDISEAPYYVQISDQHRSLFCGGTVVAEDLVVTAAHCLKTNNILMQHIRVTANAAFRNKEGVERKVIGIKIHPKYDPETLNADVAVLKVNNRFFLKKNRISRAGLCKEAPKDDNDITVVGWGSMGKDVSAPTSLQSITVKALSYESCASVMNITKTMICTKVTDNKDACQGDSGGPAMYQGRLCGVVSWGVGCGLNGMPGVYTSIVKVRGFINSILNNTVTFD